jgi:hypothetical protein
MYGNRPSTPQFPHDAPQPSGAITLNVMLKELPVQMPQWIRERFPPDQRAAVDYLRRLIDVDMLREIAEADYAQDVSEHLAALKPIWEGGELRELHYWYQSSPWLPAQTPRRLCPIHPRSLRPGHRAETKGPQTHRKGRTAGQAQGGGGRGPQPCRAAADPLA